MLPDNSFAVLITVLMLPTCILPAYRHTVKFKVTHLFKNAHLCTKIGENLLYSGSVKDSLRRTERYT